MRVAVLADVHGNLPALDAVLAGVLLGSDVTVRRTGYDAQAAGRAMRAAAPRYPALDEFIAENVVTVPSDALALAVFSS